MSLITVGDRGKRKIISMEKTKRNLCQISFKTHNTSMQFQFTYVEISIWLTKKSENHVPFVKFCNVLCVSSVGLSVRSTATEDCHESPSTFSSALSDALAGFVSRARAHTHKHTQTRTRTHAQHTHVHAHSHTDQCYTASDDLLMN